jgi:hypothetical protein
MNFKRLDRRDALFAPALAALRLDDQDAPDTLWARRSHFDFGAQSVLVTEIFSPTLLQFDASDPASTARTVRSAAADPCRSEPPHNAIAGKEDQCASRF